MPGVSRSLARGGRRVSVADESNFQKGPDVTPPAWANGRTFRWIAQRAWFWAGTHEGHLWVGPTSACPGELRAALGAGRRLGRFGPLTPYWRGAVVVPEPAVQVFAIDAVCTLRELYGCHRAFHDRPLLDEADGYGLILASIDAVEAARADGLALGLWGPANLVVARDGGIHWMGWGDSWRGPASEEAALNLIRPPGVAPGAGYDLVAELRTGVVAVGASPTYMEVSPRVRDVLAGRPDPARGGLLTAHEALMRGLYGAPAERFTSLAEVRRIFLKIVAILGLDVHEDRRRERLRQRIAELIAPSADGGPSARGEGPLLVSWPGTVVDLAARVVRSSGDTVPLTLREAEVLAYLARHTERVVSHRELLTEVWGYAPTTQSRAVADLLKRLRPKIEAGSAAPRRLVTVHGHGVRLVFGEASEG